MSLDDSQGISLLYLEGGAFLDFRTADGKSPLHRAASRGNVSAVTVRAAKCKCKGSRSGREQIG